MNQFLNQLAAAPSPFGALEPKRRTRSPLLGPKRRRRLIENLHLDSVCLRPEGWVYPADTPANRGENLSQSAISEATRRLNSHPSARNSSNFSSLLSEAVKALNPQLENNRVDFFFRVARTPTPLTGRVWNVCSLSTLQYSFGGPDGPWERAVYDWLESPDPATLPLQPDRGALGLCRKDSAFWLSDQSPLDLLASRNIKVGSADAAWAILRELALPGFETRQRRKEAMGLVAIEFAANRLQDGNHSGVAWKPTAIDALNFKGYCFLPGGPSDDHGLTWPLQQTLYRHEQRNGLREYVHPHIAVPAIEGGVRMVHLLGFLDADAETKWNSLAP